MYKKHGVIPLSQVKIVMFNIIDVLGYVCSEIYYLKLFVKRDFVKLLINDSHMMIVCYFNTLCFI